MLNRTQDIAEPPRWLTLKQAATYCPYGTKRLIQMIKNKTIKGGRLKDKGKEDWFIDRISIDKHMNSMCYDDHVRAKAFAILKRVK